MKLSPEQERERLARWLRNGEHYEPQEYARKLRNSDDYDDWDVGLEPIPRDSTWTKEKAPDGADDQMETD